MQMPRLGTASPAEETPGPLQCLDPGLQTPSFGGSRLVYRSIFVPSNPGIRLWEAWRAWALRLAMGCDCPGARCLAGRWLFRERCQLWGACCPCTASRLPPPTPTPVTPHCTQPLHSHPPHLYCCPPAVTGGSGSPSGDSI